MFARPLAHSFVTLAEILAGRGYSTLGVAANYAYLAPRFQLDQGFDLYDARRPIPVLDPAREYFLRHGMRRALGVFFDTAAFDRTYRSAQEINADVFPLLERAADRQIPFFLFVNYLDAHLPYIPPPPLDSRYPGKRPGLSYAEIRALTVDVLSGKRQPSSSERAHLISQYDGSIAYLDAQIGNLLDRLKALQIFEHTLIVVTSDHGEAFGDRYLLEPAALCTRTRCLFAGRKVPWAASRPKGRCPGERGRRHANRPRGGRQRARRVRWTQPARRAHQRLLSSLLRVLLQQLAAEPTPTLRPVRCSRVPRYLQVHPFYLGRRRAL